MLNTMIKVALQALAALLLFGCNVAGGNEGEGFEFVIRVDDPEPQFPEPVYAFVSIKNTAGEPAYIARISQLHKIHVRCCPAGMTFELGPRGYPYFAKEPPGFTSAGTYDLTAGDPTFLGRITQRTRCRVITSIRMRPAQIDAETAAAGKGIELGPVPDSEYLMANAETELMISPDRSIFKSLTGDLAAVAAQPAAWRTLEQMNELAYGRGQTAGKQDIQLCFLDEDTIRTTPILWVFPERLDSIQELLVRDTASWRLLELRRLLRRYYLETTSIEKMQQVLDALIGLLKCCGPAELFVLEKRITRRLLNGRDPINPDEPEELMIKISHFYRGYWAAQLQEHFPGEPLEGGAMAAHYHADGTPRECD